MHTLSDSPFEGGDEEGNILVQGSPVTENEAQLLVYSAECVICSVY